MPVYDRTFADLKVKTLAKALLLGLLVSVSQVGRAADKSGMDGDDSKVLGWFDSVYVQAGYGVHWGDSDDFKGAPILGGIEADHDDRHLIGVSLFNNSFDQFSQYFYYGYKWRLPAISESVHFKLTGGLIHGYTGEYEDKIAFNNSGWAPAIIPSLGWKRDRLGFDVAVLGNNGVMFLVGYDAWSR